MEENKKIVIAVDAMGGDFAPVEPVKGAVEALAEEPQISVLLFGKEKEIQAELAKYTYDDSRVQVICADDVITTSEHPVQAIRTKKESSLVKALYAVKNGEADAMVSCGNTGALLVGGQTIVGRIRGIERAALAFLVPTMAQPAMILDVGANVDCRPEMLVQFAKMGSIYMENIVKRSNPRVGVLNIGEEEEKGNVLVKSTIPLLNACESIHFIGSVESRGLTEGLVDVLVCDGFVGNTMLKTYEGVAGSIIAKLKESLLGGSTKTKVGALLIKSDLKKMMKEFSVDEYGGAPMLGLKNLVVKPHGNSQAVEIKNAIKQCRDFVSADIPAKIAQNI